MAAAAAAAASGPTSEAAALCQKACGGGNPYGKGGARAGFLDTIVSNNAFAAREPAHKLFSKIAGNILSNPSEEKYRKLNVAKVIGRFGSDFVGIAELLRSVGFVAEAGNLVLPSSVPLAALCQSMCAWNDREEKFSAARAEADRVRAENMKYVSADRARKEAARAQIKSLSAQARADVAAKPINDSKGNAIKFGSTLVKAPPPPPDAKGG